MARIHVMYAGGFPGYRTERDEIDKFKRDLWWPSTPDFDATAAYTGKLRYPVSLPSEFFGSLTKVGSARRIVFIGHGGKGQIGLTGRGTSFKHQIDLSELKSRRAWIHSNLRPKLKNRTLDLFTCYGAAGSAFAQQLATDLGVTVRAFSGPVFWTLVLDESKKKIVRRGLMCPTSKCKKKIKGAHKVAPPKKFVPKGNER